MTPANITLLIFALATILFVVDVLPMGLLVFAVPVSLYFAGVIEAKAIFAPLVGQSIILVVAMSVIGAALFKTGAAERISHAVISVADGHGPLLLMAILWLTVWGLTQVMSNTATCALFCPIGWSIAQTLGADPRAVVIAVLIASSVAVCTPLAIPANSMILVPGNLRFKDFLKPGLALSAAAFILSMILLPLLYPFFNPASN